jgi:endonuclease/exonuclease/phosphatase family metal-dependent hydrolase
MRTVLSLNIRGFQLGGDPLKARIGPLYDYAKAHSVDEVHLQEVFTYGILRELIRHMPLRHAVYEKGIAGPKGGLVSFYRERLERVTFYPLAPAGLARLDFLRLAPYIHKGLLVAYLADGGIRCNLHLDSNHSGDWERPSRQARLIARQLDQVAAVIRDLIQVNRPDNVLVMGDFNLPHTTQAYKDFVRGTQLRDAFEDNRAPTYHAAFLPKGRQPHQVDHMLFWSSPESGFTLGQSEYVFAKPIREGGREVYVSDHIGLAVMPTR